MGTGAQLSPQLPGDLCTFIFALGSKLLASDLQRGWAVVPPVPHLGELCGPRLVVWCEPGARQDWVGTSWPPPTHPQRCPLSPGSEGNRSRALLLASVAGWRLMIHIPGRLRVSDEVVICFPLQSLCAFLFWLQLRQQVLERQTLAPAKKESGDARELRERERERGKDCLLPWEV